VDTIAPDVTTHAMTGATMIEIKTTAATGVVPVLGDSAAVDSARAAQAPADVVMTSNAVSATKSSA
jgi:hypothetical protein